ncbi:MAG: glycosyltransferase [Candidatus Eisenbacteria bacterium]
MKILNTSRCFYPATQYGGPIWKMRAIAGGLSELGHSITVYTSNLTSPGKKMSARTTTDQVDAARVVYFNSLLSYHWDAVTPEIMGLCHRELRTFDVIHVYGYRDFLSTVVCWYARRWDIPYVLEPMGMFIPIVRSFAKKRIYDRLLGRKLTGGAARVIATSLAEQQDLISAGIDPEKIVVRRNGLDLAEFKDRPVHGRFRERLGLAPSDRLVLYLGRISRKKGIDLLIQAFSNRGIPRTRLAVVGPDDCDGYLNELKTLVETLGLTNHVTFIPPIYGSAKLTALSDADVFVLPSQNENFGNAVAEAVACRTPVIVTDRCGIAPFIIGKQGAGSRLSQNAEYGEGFGTQAGPGLTCSIGVPPPANLHASGAEPGLAGRGDPAVQLKDVATHCTEGRVGLVIPYDVGALGDAMVRVLLDDDLANRFRQNAPGAAEELSWDEPIRQMEGLYEGIRRKS